MTLRSFPCKRCGTPVPVPDEALADPAATPVCPACGQRYARRPAAPGATVGGPPTASRFTSQQPAGPAATSGPAATQAGGALRVAERPAAFVPGELVGNRYRIVRFVARGGMGEVYEAEDVELRGRVALKTIHPGAAGDAGAVERFKREIHLARRVTHPNVCRIFDVGFHAPAPAVASEPVVFLTMEMLEGETLATRLRREGRLTPAAALPIARQLAEALFAAHEAGIVHRDFKPENVFLVPGREGERAVVTDFGIARGGGDEGFGVTLTVDGNVIGTPAYMAPEQVEGGAVSAASDQYAFGVVLFEMLTGELPFRGDNPLSTAARRLTEAPPSPRSFAPELDGRWEQVILRCLARRPGERFGDVRAASRALDEAAPDAGASAPTRWLGPPRAVEDPPPLFPAAAGPSGPTPALARRAPAERRKRALALLLVVLLAAASAWAWWRVREIRERLSTSTPAAARRAVAVLDLRDLAGQPETRWLSTALAEMLASELAQGARLRVIPAETVAHALDDLGLAGRDALAAPERLRLRQRLGADYLVLGAYTALDPGAPAGGLRLDLRLEDARGAQTIASVRENGTQGELFDLVGRAGVGLRRALGADEGRDDARPVPISSEAARLYAEGLEALRRFDPQLARELLERAVAAAPTHALARSALASAWSSLGYAARAEAEALRAREAAAGLPAEERLIVEARYFESAGRWAQAAEIWERLWGAYPDVAGHGLRLATCRTRAGQADRALAAVGALRALPPPAGQDPRIDLAEAAAAAALADFPRQAEAAARAAERALGDGSTLAAAEALVLRGWALRALGRAAEAQAAIERARELFAERGDRSGISSADAALGGVLLDRGEPAAARAAFERALATARELGDRGAEAGVLNNLAVLARTRGENEAARASYARVVELFEETGNPAGSAVASNNLAVCLTELGELEEAAVRVDSALAQWRSAGDRAGLAAGLGTLGGVRRRTGDLAGAEAAWREALALRLETGERRGEAIARNGLAQTLLEAGELDAAEAELAAAEALARELGAKSALASALVGRAEAAAARGEEPAALALLAEAGSLRRELGERAGAARVRTIVARLDLAGDPAAAARAAREVLAAAPAERTPEVDGAARIVLARALVAGRDAAAAREALAAPGLPERLSLAQRLDWRLAGAELARAAEARGGGAGPARAEAAAVRAEAERTGFDGVALEASLLEVELAGGAGAPELAARARAAGYGSIARRAERLAPGR